jgi:putative ABC transport system substrate-binding protein
MRRREFITALGGAAAWPLVVQAQQKAAGSPVIGFLSLRTSVDSPLLVTALRQGLRETGYVEGQNLTVEYRWAEGHYDRLPAMAADLLDHKVAVIINRRRQRSGARSKGRNLDNPSGLRDRRGPR